MPLQYQIRFGSRRSAGISLLIVCFVLASLCGCSPSYQDSKTDSSTNTPVSSDVEPQVNQISENFIKAIQARDYKAASSFFSAKLQKQMPVSQLNQMTKTGLLKPIVNAGPRTFEPVHLNREGNRATVRLSFNSDNQKKYRMNLVFGKTGTKWEIQSVVPPVTQGRPLTSEGTTSAPK